MRTFVEHRVATFAVAVALLLPRPADAAPPAAVGTRHFSVPGGSLTDAIAAFTAQSGAKVVISAPDAGLARVNGVTGDYPDQEAFARMLNGSGLSWHMIDGAFVVDGMVVPAGAGEHVLSAIQVEGADGGGSFPSLDGFGAGAGANGSSDVTATEGTNSLTTNGTSVATKVPTSVRDTPQTVSVITNTQIKQQNLTDVFSALESTPGITIANVPGNGGLQNNYIYSRGYAIGTYVVDGGAPIKYQNRGGETTPDLSEYDHVEVLAGSDALFGGAGNPGGVVSLVRKRPLDHRQIEVSGHYGSWNDGRVEADVSAPVALDGHLRARFDVAYQNRDFFYDFAHENMLHLYGVLEGDIDADTVVRVGGSFQKQDSRSDNAEGLPRYWSGADLKLPRSTNFSEPWAYSHDKRSEAFAQLEHKFGSDWQANASVTHIEQRRRALQAYFQGPVSMDDSNIYFLGPWLSGLKNLQTVIDGHANGSFDVFGRAQKVVVGVDYQTSMFAFSSLQPSAFGPTNVFRPDLSEFAEHPTNLDPATSPDGGSAIRQVNPNHQWGLYGNATLEPLKGFHLNFGLRYSNYFNKSFDDQRFYLFGSESGGSFTSKQTLRNVVTPSASLVYDLSKRLSVYFSYADIYNQPSANITETGQLLPPERGKTFEGGLKFADNGSKLNASLALFAAQEKNIPLFASIGPFNTQGACCYLPGAAQKNTGVQLQVAGEVHEGWQINAGYTYLHVDYNKAYRDYLSSDIFPATSTQEPRHQVKIWSSYVLKWVKGLTLLAGLRLDSARFTQGSVCSVITNTSDCPTEYIRYDFVQPLYAVGDIGVEYQFDRHWMLSVNLTNISDKRYYATAGTNYANNFYGEPRKILATVRVKY